MTGIAAADTADVLEPAQASEALYALFSLLEQHEPDWYLRKHHRVAHAVLSTAGLVS
jgi:hypothetical protein